MHWLLIMVLAFDLAAVKTEPNLERRSDLALDNANAALDEARDAYNSNDAAKTETALDEVRASVDLAYESLQETGKDARRNPKSFKRAELKTRQLLRRLEGLRDSFAAADRALVDRLTDRVSKVHDALLTDIMGKNRR